MRVEQGAVVFLVDTQHVNISRYVRQYPGALSGPSFQKQQWQPCGVGILEPAASLQAMQTHNGS
jgi:hypothetical protein